jgi:hypothetical protein
MSILMLKGAFHPRTDLPVTVPSNLAYWLQRAVPAGWMAAKTGRVLV